MNKKLTSNYGFRNKSYRKEDGARKETKKALKSLDVRPSKERGQNFVVNDLVISSIVEFGSPKPSEFLLEIGPGLGALTKALLPFGLKAVIEIEEAFAKQTKEHFPQLEVFLEDARNFDFSRFGVPVTIFANLPYSISSEMILNICAMECTVISRVVLMLQKEFAERLSAKVGSHDYGILSVFCQKAAHVKLGPVIAAEFFHPRPKIDSQVIEFKFKNSSGDSKEQIDFFRKVVRASFAKRRKKLINSILSSGNFSEEKVLQAMQDSGISSNSRAQELSFQEFEKFSKCLAENDQT